MPHRWQEKHDVFPLLFPNLCFSRVSGYDIDKCGTVMPTNVGHTIFSQYFSLHAFRTARCVISFVSQVRLANIKKELQCQNEFVGEICNGSAHFDRHRLKIRVHSLLFLLETK